MNEELQQEELLAKLSELQDKVEELTTSNKELEEKYSETKSRLDKANELSQKLISQYALKGDSKPIEETPKKSVEDSLLDVIKKYN